MTQPRFSIVLKMIQAALAPVFLALIIVLMSHGPATAQTFHGPYLGIDAARQHVIAGSLVDDVDTLQQDSRMVVSVFGGLRAQVAGFVIGGDLGVGRLDGEMRLDESSTAIRYQADSQWRWSLHGGHVVGSRTLMFGYLSEVTRQFDVTLTGAGVTSSQQDKQGMLRFGAGVEQQIRGPWHLTVTAGSARADFGGRRTNIVVGQRLEVAAGLTVQF